MSKIDERTEEVLRKYLPEGYNTNDAVWPLEKKNKKGELFIAAWIAKHKALEVIAAHNNVRFDLPVIYEQDSSKAVSMLVVGHLGEKTEWSIGEASIENYSAFKGNGYKWAMAEKRGKDRVILKLMGLHGDLYSQEEAEEFEKQPSNIDKIEEDVPITKDQVMDIRKLMKKAKPNLENFHEFFNTVNESGEGDIRLLKSSQYEKAIQLLNAKIQRNENS